MECVAYRVMNPKLTLQVDVECDWWEAEQWCNEYIGKWNEDWYKLGIDPAASMFGNNTTHWFFEDEQKQLLFILRWA